MGEGRAFIRWIYFLLLPFDIPNFCPIFTKFLKYSSLFYLREFVLSRKTDHSETILWECILFVFGFFFCYHFTLHTISIGTQLGATFENYIYFGYLFQTCAFLGTLALKLLINKHGRCEWYRRIKHKNRSVFVWVLAVGANFVCRLAVWNVYSWWLVALFAWTSQLSVFCDEKTFVSLFNSPVICTTYPSTSSYIFNDSSIWSFVELLVMLLI